MEIHAVGEAGAEGDEVAEIAEAAGADRFARGRGMHVNDVRADADVGPHRDAEPRRRTEDADAGVRRLHGGGAADDPLRETLTEPRAVGNRAVELARGFLRHPELAG